VPFVGVVSEGEGVVMLVGVDCGREVRLVRVLGGNVGLVELVVVI
jgi:hypothetical protein